MAAKIDMKKHGGKVKGAGELPATAAGNAPATGMPKSVAPDVISAPRASKSGYGQNGWARASSLTPMDDSNKGVSPLAANMKAAGERGSDAVLDTIVKNGTRQDSSITSQLRDISSKNVPDAFGMESARSRQPGYPGPKNATLPATTAKSDAQPIRKPPA